MLKRHQKNDYRLSSKNFTYKELKKELELKYPTFVKTKQKPSLSNYSNDFLLL